MEQGDRHKGKRVYKSGAEKRKIAQGKENKREEVIAKIRRMTEFFVFQPTASSSLLSPADCLADAQTQNVTLDETQESKQQQEETRKFDSELEYKRNEYACDIGLWPENMGSFVDYWAKKGTKDLQNCDEELFKQKSCQCDDHKEEGIGIRRCQTSMFKRKTRNGEIINRSWLCFSPSNGRVYCFVCKLMSPVRTQFSYEGFFDWKHASNRLMSHETSKAHLNAVVTIANRSKELGRIDSELEKQALETRNYWQTLLIRVISVIKFACERGLALRGDNELVGSPYNVNYLGLLELIAEHDDFLKQHIKNYANRGSGHANYLSSTVCEEIIHLMGKRVLEEIVFRIKKSKYFSISLDSTPDEGHIDQLTLIFRYIEYNTPIERFLRFMPIQGHKAQDIFNALMEFLKSHDIDINDCRGQSYDNASVMSGKYNGVQAKIHAENSLASWIPCAAHSLNLVAKSAAECCPAAVAFFDFLEELYLYFTISTQRYALLTECLNSFADQTPGRILVPKRVTTTRWSCRSDACKALVAGYDQIKDTLIKISEDLDQLPKARCDANGLHTRMCMIETGFYAVFWNEILDRTNATSQLLQSAKLDLNSATAAISSLKEFILGRRDNFSTYESLGAEKAGTTDYVVHRRYQRNVRLIPLDYGQAPEVELTPQNKFKIENFIPVIDQFLSSLNQRLSAYESVSARFGFLRRLDSLSPQEIEAHANGLASTYADDLDGSLGIELIQFIDFFKIFKDEYITNDLNKELSIEHFMYKILIEKDVKDAFPNVEIALRMYLVLMITNCSSERSFSKLKLLKNRLRTTMVQERLNDLTIMSLESDILREINTAEVIDDFTRRKRRKMSFK